MSKREEIRVVNWKISLKYIIAMAPLIVWLFIISREVIFIFTTTSILSAYLYRVGLDWYDYQTIKMSIYGVLIGCYAIAITVLFAIGGIIHFGGKWLDKNIDEN